MHSVLSIYISLSSFIEIAKVLLELWSRQGNTKSQKVDNLKINCYTETVMVLV